MFLNEKHEGLEKKELDYKNPEAGKVIELLKDASYLDSIIKKGKDKAISVADPILGKVYEIIGFSKV